MRNHCKLLTNNANPAVNCTFVDGALACSTRFCSAVSPAASSEADCNNWIATCRWNGKICVDAGTCISYNAAGADDAANDNFAGL